MTGTLRRSLIDRPTWMADGACVGTDPDVMYPPTAKGERAAIAICRGCDVQSHCLAYALTLEERYGVWGGLTAYQRRNVLNGDAPGPIITGKDRWKLTTSVGGR